MVERRPSFPQIHGHISPDSPRPEPRLGRPQDAPAIAQLFQKTYGDSSHPCRDPHYVSRSLSNPDHRWLLMEDEAGLAACIARIFIRRLGLGDLRWMALDLRCRGRGLAKSLYAASVRLGDGQGGAAYDCAEPRSAQMVHILRAARPLHLLGHDGGENVAGGGRETHVFGIHPRPGRPIPWSPPPLPPAALAHLRGGLLRDLPLQKADAGAPPPLPLIAPPSPHRLDIGRTQFTLSAAPGRPANTQRIGLPLGARPTLGDLGRDLGRLMKGLAHIPHVACVAPLSGAPMMAMLLELGFVPTAYLPSWWGEGRARHDALKWVRATHAPWPQANGNEGEVRRLDAELRGLLDALGLALPSQPSPPEARPAASPQPL